MRTPDGSQVERWAARIAVASVASTILVAGVRAVLDGWYPIGDNALLTLRARDVLTEHHPWLGTWTSASLSVGTPINNPGPLQFDLLAPFAKLDADGGMAIGVAVLNALAVVLIAVFARRLGGDRLVAISMVAPAALVWTMGSELLFDPWQPHSMLLPFLALAVLCVAVAAGDEVALPWAVGVGSYIVQTHLSYAVLVPGLLVVALISAGVGLRRRFAAASDRAALRRRVVRWVIVAVVVGLLLWAQPLWEQVARSGNLVEVARSAGQGDAVVGPEAGVRIAGSVIGEPTGWLRPSFEETLQSDVLGERIVSAGPPNVGVRSLPTAVRSLLLVGALLAGSAWVARRRDDRTGAAVAVIGLAAVGLAITTTTSLPVSDNFGVSPHQVRWLWPIAAFSAVLPLSALLPRHRSVTVAAALVALVGAVGTLPSANMAAGPSADAAAQEPVRELADQIQEWSGTEVLHFDGRTVAFAEPFSGPVLLELQRRGVPFEVDAEFSRQVGSGRLGPRRATGQLRFLSGEAAAAIPPGTETLAVVDGLDEEEQDRLARLTRDLRAALADTELRLNGRGSRARELGLVPQLPDDWTDDVALLLDGGLLWQLVTEEYVDPASLPPGAQEYASLRRRQVRYSVAVVVEPLGR